MTRPESFTFCAGEVALDNTLRDGTDRIRSDGAGTYSDGAAGVAAIIMDNGNLSFDLGGSDSCMFLEFEAPAGATWGGTCEQTRTSSGDPGIDGGFTVWRWDSR